MKKIVCMIALTAITFSSVYVYGNPVKNGTTMAADTTKKKMKGDRKKVKMKGDSTKTKMKKDTMRTKM